MPLHAEGKTGRISNPDRLDGAVLRHAFDDDPWPGSSMPWPCSELTRIVSHPRMLRKRAAANQADLMPIGEDDVGSGWISPFSSRGIR